jgi:hypothetical protein
MIVALAFLTCAMSLPALNYTRPAIVSYHAARNEEDKLRDWIQKNNPDSDVFIHENPQEGKLKEYGWERFPATYKGKQIWIRRSPVSDKRQKMIGTSA